MEVAKTLALCLSKGAAALDSVMLEFLETLVANLQEP